jgi:hypothetical protein
MPTRTDDDAPQPAPAPPNPSPPALDPVMRACIVCTAASGAVLALGGLLAFGLSTGFGVAVGGAIATANLALFAQIGKAFLDRRGISAPWAAVAMVKFFALVAGVWLILRTGMVSPLALAVGYGALPIGITVGGLFGPKPPE